MLLLRAMSLSLVDASCFATLRYADITPPAIFFMLMLMLRRHYAMLIFH